MTTAAHALAADWISPLSGVRVLLVEDDADSRELLEVVLSGAGMIVDSASSVAEAFEALMVNRPDVIVSDIGMPFENGYSFLRNLRQVLLEEGASIPAVAVTGFARPEDRDRALAAGFSVHLAKPIDPEQVLRVLADLIRQEQGGSGGPWPPKVAW
jgi:CheY-like chemotaxis protein